MELCAAPSQHTEGEWIRWWCPLTSSWTQIKKDSRRWVLMKPRKAIKIKTLSGECIAVNYFKSMLLVHISLYLIQRTHRTKKESSLILVISITSRPHSISLTKILDSYSPCSLSRPAIQTLRRNPSLLFRHRVLLDPYHLKHMIIFDYEQLCKYSNKKWKTMKIKFLDGKQNTLIETNLEALHVLAFLKCLWLHILL